MIDLEVLKRIAQVLFTLSDAGRAVQDARNYPAVNGDFGEFIAAGVFPISLHRNPLHPGSDGFFVDGRYGGASLRDKTVEIKRYAKHGGYLDLKPNPPDFYLVITGPRSTEKPPSPWAIESVFLFDGPRLHADLEKRGVKIGEPTSIRSELWEGAEIYPRRHPDYRLEVEQRVALALFAIG